jgi:hypothetical protein
VSSLHRPTWRGYLGKRTLAAFVATAALGLALLLIGTLTSQSTLRGVGIIFLLFGIALTVGLGVRWLIYREVG